jgi:hypothetical protein
MKFFTPIFLSSILLSATSTLATPVTPVTEANILCDKLVLFNATLINDRVSKTDAKKYNQCLSSNKKLNTVINKQNLFSINTKYNKLR